MHIDPASTERTDAPSQSGAETAVDPLRLDTDRLQALAEPHLIQAALRHCNDRRVTAVHRLDHELAAEVEDEDSEEKLRVEIAVDDDGSLSARCDCGGEPDSGLCVHALAALFAHAKGLGDDPSGLADAAQAALDERLTKARAEVQAEPLSDAARATGLGLWQARSLQSTTHFATQYRVHIRSLTRRANYCTCPDFATNQLGTCKHIEAVLHRLRKRPGFKQAASQVPPRGYVFLDWDTEPAPGIRLHRGLETPETLARVLDEHFQADGIFRGRVPDDFLRLVEQLGDQSPEGIDIGDDAVGHARRLAEDATRERRAAEIGARIRDGGGRLPGIRARLYPYQVEGVAFLAGRGRGLLADDMGLGKTLQAIAAAYWLHRNDGVERVLIVCPASLKLQWARELERFTGAEAQVIAGPAAARGVQYRRGTGFYVVNYELVMRDIEVINSDLRPDLLILDEAQRIKNWRTKIASTIKRIASRYAFVLTGTPLENRLEDLYSLLQVIDARVLGPLWRYLVDFHITDERGKVLGYRNLSALRRRLAPVMLRRDRSLVRDQLPERTLTRLDVPLSDCQRGLHDEALQAATMLAQIMRRRPLTPSEQKRMMAALQRARMACNAAALVDPEAAERHPDSAPKLDELTTLLDELCRGAGLKAVIFSQWTRMTELAEARARNLGLGCVRLHGGVPSNRRGALMDRFRDDDATQVFISTDAGGVGLNLQNAAVLINLDIPWNPAVLDQRIARVHRLGQRQKVQAILLVATDSYEERVLGLVQGKRALFDNVVDPDATEDVVSVSKRLAEVLAEDLGGSEPANATEPATASATDQASASADASDPSPAPRSVPPAEPTPRPDLSEPVRERLIGLQRTFGPRIQRILGQRRRTDADHSGGLLVVLDHVGDDDDARLDALAGEVPVALIDRRTLASLDRLGAASPITGAEPVYAPAQADAAPTEHPLDAKARANLDAARLLIQQGCPGPALDLLIGALLAAAARRAERDQPPTPAEAAIWLYGEALPSGRLQADDAALLMRAIALAQGGDAVPEPLLTALADDSARFIGA